MPLDCFRLRARVLLRIATPRSSHSERRGVVARVVANVKTATLEAFVNEAVSHKLSLLCIDQWVGYHGLSKKGYPHATIDHAAKEYGVDAVRTNTIEGFWSIIKRGIVGTFHNVSKEILASLRCGVPIPL